MSIGLEIAIYRHTSQALIVQRPKVISITSETITSTGAGIAIIGTELTHESKIIAVKSWRASFVTQQIRLHVVSV